MKRSLNHLIAILLIPTALAACGLEADEGSQANDSTRATTSDSSESDRTDESHEEKNNDKAASSRKPLDLPEFDVYKRKDVSYDFGDEKAARLSLRVRVRQWPVTKQDLKALAEHLLKKERKNGWHAVSIAMGANRNETLPAYAMFEWAPQGDWGRASEGDPDTWAGYRWAINWGEKMENPETSECAKPPKIAFIYNKELWDAPAMKSEKKIIEEIALRHGDTPKHVKELLMAVLDWEFC